MKPGWCCVFGTVSQAFWSNVDYYYMIGSISACVLSDVSHVCASQWMHLSSSCFMCFNMELVELSLDDTTGGITHSLTRPLPAPSVQRRKPRTLYGGSIVWCVGRARGKSYVWWFWHWAQSKVLDVVAATTRVMCVRCMLTPHFIIQCHPGTERHLSTHASSCMEVISMI